ncbi:tripartite tricarboxylate transporter substrate binding protein [Ammoniphilus sp. YIM 78166]|uniref:Bug family tripartite tricarboxylate transporter substrate binding protein n=1 Tax=Ammoniphilus sp. YIM 78166 TaxID=1644106 RepID=UPI001070680E|nr:tripartite tricarboxylate transporter substrate binding protein [Ammoniphilus sp. YIM 78166]
MKKWKFLSTLAVVGALAFNLVGCSSSSQETQATNAPAEQAPKADFPTKPIQMIVPFAPGGTTDIAARSLSSVVHNYLPNGQSVAIVNKDGGGGTIGMTEVAKAKADGYTIGMATSGPITIKPHGGQIAYDAPDFKPVMQVVATPNVLVVKADAPWQTFEEWLEYVKGNPEVFTYSTSGAGLTQHITMENFTVKTGAKLKHVPFQGGSPALTALLGDNVKGAVVQTTEALPHIQEGTVRPLFIAGTFKPEELKDVPLLSEKGIDVKGDVWTGIVVPKDVPDEVIAILHEAFKQALEDPAVVDQFKKIGAAGVYKSPSEFQAQIDEDYKINGDVLEAIGLKK